MMNNDNDNAHWQTLHLELQDLLAGYHDNELEPHQIELVEAHLAGCNDCRNDLARQQSLSTFIEDLPPEHLSKINYQKIEAAINNAAGTTQDTAQDSAAKDSAQHTDQNSKTSFARKVALLFTQTSWLSRDPKQKLFANSGWAIACVLLAVLLLPQFPSRVPFYQNEIPMIDDALVQYRQLQQQNLPLSTALSTSPPLSWGQATLLTSWATEIGGAPAQVFAMRHNNQIVLQYKIDQRVFFRNAKVRQAIANQGMFQTHTTNADILVLPGENAGIIIVGPKNALPSRDSISNSSA